LSHERLPSPIEALSERFIFILSRNEPLATPARSGVAWGVAYPSRFEISALALAEHREARTLEPGFDTWAKNPKIRSNHGLAWELTAVNSDRFCVNSKCAIAAPSAMIYGRGLTSTPDVTSKFQRNPIQKRAQCRYHP
jgi:hypothetical protein